jgi:AbrB family transcriptional regulator (stage V sporulation protein T)
MDMKTESWHSQAIRVRIAAGGRVVIPADIRQGLGVKEGDELLITRDGDGIRMTTVQQAVKEVQAFFGQFKKPGESMVDDFLGSRREEAAKEKRESGT